MKFLNVSALAAMFLASGSAAMAVMPVGSNYGCSTGYGLGATQYGSQFAYGAPIYSGYQPYQAYPQYGQTWNTPYRTQTYCPSTMTYDPVHGDYHVTSAHTHNRPFNQNVGYLGSTYRPYRGTSFGW